jgi:SAM-dependent methyltransferase
LRFDPLSHELYLFGKAKAPLGHIVDAGCGRGQFAFLLLELGYGTQVWGFDHDAAKVAVAQKAALSLSGGTALSEASAHFETGDLKSKSLPAADTLLLLDVLHYLDLQAQDEVLQRSIAALNESGHLLVRETNYQGGFGSRVAGFFEVLARLFRINRGDQLVFRAPGELEAVLKSHGLTVVRHTPKGALDNVLLVATKSRTTT